MTDPISIFAGMAKSLEDCPPPEERQARLKMVMAADALRKAADHIDAQAARIASLKSLLGRYADHVGAEEGTDFLDRVWTESPITEAEAKEISSYSPALRALSHEGGE